MVTSHQSLITSHEFLISQEPQNSVGQRRVRVGLDHQVPMPLISKTLAFYRVFFRHDHGRIVTELNVLASVVIVVGKDVLGNVDLELSQLLKEPARIANASERVDSLAGKAG